MNQSNLNHRSLTTAIDPRIQPLRKVEHFKDVSRKWWDFVSRGELFDLETGDTLSDQDAPRGAMFILLGGQVVVQTEPNLPVTHETTGALFGELSFFGSKFQPFKCVALQKSQVCYLSADTLYEQYDDGDRAELFLDFAKIFAGKLEQANQKAGHFELLNQNLGDLHGELWGKFEKEQKSANALRTKVEQSRFQHKLTLNQLKKAEKVKEDFLGTVSHELRTPLNIIIGMGQIGLLECSEPQREILMTMVDEGRQLSEMVDAILVFLEKEQGKVTLQELPFQLSGAFSNHLKTYQQQAQEQGLTFDIEWDPNFPRCAVGDVNRIKKTLVILVQNALKFTHTGHIHCSTELIVKTANYITLRFAVEDTGIGISEEFYKHIFNGFSQVDGSATREFNGVGLGLAVAKLNIEAMGGTIGVDSEPGEGSRFWFELPLQLACNPMPKCCCH